MSALPEKTIAYRSGYKYQLAETYMEQTGIYPPMNILRPFYCIYSDGLIVAKTGYAWDGPSGPAIDTKNFMRGSLVHDVVCQAIAEHALPHLFREQGDKELKRIFLEDCAEMYGIRSIRYKLCRIRAWWIYRAVRLAGENPSIMPEQHPLEFAPCRLTPDP